MSRQRRTAASSSHDLDLLSTAAVSPSLAQSASVGLKPRSTSRFFRPWPLHAPLRRSPVTSSYRGRAADPSRYPCLDNCSRFAGRSQARSAEAPGGRSWASGGRFWAARSRSGRESRLSSGPTGHRARAEGAPDHFYPADGMETASFLRRPREFSTRRPRSMQDPISSGVARDRRTPPGPPGPEGESPPESATTPTRSSAEDHATHANTGPRDPKAREDPGANARERGGAEILGLTERGTGALCATSRAIHVLSMRSPRAPGVLLACYSCALHVLLACFACSCRGLDALFAWLFVRSPRALRALLAPLASVASGGASSLSARCSGSLASSAPVGYLDRGGLPHAAIGSALKLYARARA